MLLQQSIEHMSIVYTLNTYFVMHWSMYLIQEFQVNVLLQHCKLYKTPIQKRLCL